MHTMRKDCINPISISLSGRGLFLVFVNRTTYHRPFILARMHNMDFCDRQSSTGAAR